MDYTGLGATEGAHSGRESDIESLRTDPNGEADTMNPAPAARTGDPYPDSWLCYIITFVLTLASSSLEAPSMRLLENAVCREYYDQHKPWKYLLGSDIPETECKSGSIQAHFAMLITITMVGKNLVGEKWLHSLIPRGAMAKSACRACCPASSGDPG